MKRTHTSIAALSLGATALLAPLAAGGSSAEAAPSFTTPLPCNYTANANVRSGHSPANAVDYQGSNINGQSALAAADGTVTRVADTGSTSYGKWVEVDHGGGYKTRYAHLSSQSVSQGATVKAGTKLGAVGSTGGSTGPHLHFEVLKNGADIVPTVDGKKLTTGNTSVTSKNCGGGGGGSESSAYPGADAFQIGKSHPAVVTLDKALIAKGYAKHHDGDGYQAGSTFTEYTKKNVQDFQKAQGWSGADADGYPGPETWKRLVG